MKLKSLLLGSAAAMIAVSGARAADAVVAEAEPVEYVRVCDMYGAGFYYIPGTDTCLSFSGYVRVQYEYNDLDDDTSNSNWRYRARVNIDARNDTDWGPLRSQIRLQSDGDGGFNGLGVVDDLGIANGQRGVQSDGIVGIDRALISLAGFRLGYSDSFTTTFHGYGNPTEIADGLYGYDQAIFFDYTYSANGFSVALGMQDTVGGSPAAQPHVNLDYYAGARYAGSWGDVAVSYLHEDVADEGSFKVSTHLNIMEGLAFNAFGLFDDGETAQVAGDGDYAWGAGLRYQATDTVRFDIGYTDADFDDAGQLAVGLRWNPVPGLSIRPTVVFNEDDSETYNIRVYRTW